MKTFGNYQTDGFQRLGKVCCFKRNQYIEAFAKRESGYDRNVKFIDLQAFRIGLCTEDLAMLLSLHIEPDKKLAQPLIDYYYSYLTNTVKDYPYELFINDFKLSVMENMFSQFDR